MNNIRKYRLQMGLKQTELCQIVGVTQGALSGWENGKYEPDIKSLDTMAKLFDVSVDELMGLKRQSSFDNVFPIVKKKLPMLGEIACGKPIFADEHRESYVSAGTDVEADFCLRAKGDSMIGARIFDGDIVFIQEMPMVNNGEIAAVVIGEEATLKRVYYYPEKGKLVLNAENPKYEPLVYIGEELNEIRILGRAVAFQSDVR